MSNLLFFSRSSAYRHAARTELHRARMLRPGAERNRARNRARALQDLARNEAWLEGQTPPMRRSRSQLRFVAPWITLNSPMAPAGLDENVLPRQQQALASRRRVNQDSLDCFRAASVPDPQSGD
jgi:hypothetical protein